MTNALLRMITTALAVLTLGALVAGQPASAQTTPASVPPASVAVDDTLAIPSPPNSTVQVDMDVRDDDLLGVLKSFLKGIGDGGQAAGAALTAPTVPMRPGHSIEMGPQVAAILSHADLGDILKDVTHVRFVVYQMAGAPRPMAAPVMKGKSSLASPAPPMMADQTPQFETAFAAEGGHRILYVNAELAHVLMVSFGHARGSALVVQGPGTLAVLRANGYPDLSKLSALATQLGSVAVQSASQSKGAPGKP